LQTKTTKLTRLCTQDHSWRIQRTTKICLHLRGFGSAKPRLYLTEKIKLARVERAATYQFAAETIATHPFAAVPLHRHSSYQKYPKNFDSQQSAAQD
jgi:hypothetical protein